jgi:predicted nucleic acid-binding protein
VVGVKAVFDTNILIDHLQGVPEAREELDRFDDRAISIVTWAEVLVGAPSRLEAETRAYLGRFEVVALSLDVC